MKTREEKIAQLRRQHAENIIVPPPKPGDVMRDGSIYIGLSPDTQAPLYAAPQDADGLLEYAEAVAYVDRLKLEKLCGRDDWNLPSKAELGLLFQMQDKGALKDSFNRRADNDSGLWYWTSAVDTEKKRGYAFFTPVSNAFMSVYQRVHVRAVRRGPAP